MKIRFLSRFSWLLLAFGIVFVVGCVEEKKEFIINPDGSGKVVYEATIQPMSFEMMGEKQDLQVQLKESVQNILTESLGVDAWKDVSHKLTDDGKVYFKGTAYFPDFNKLELGNSSFDFSMKRNGKGEIVIELEGNDMEAGGDEEAGAVAIELSEAELDKRVREEKTEYNQARMMLVEFLSTLKVETTLHLPGKIKEISNFEKLDDRSIRVAIEGAKLLGVMDEMMADDSLLRKQILAGEDPVKDGGDGLAMYEKLFGQKGPRRVVLTPDSRNLFDYDFEVSLAKKNYKKMISQLGLGAVTVERDAEVLVPKVKTAGVAKNYGKERLRLTMSVKLPLKAVSVTSGKIEKAIAGSGKNVLGDEHWDKKIDWPKLKKDNQTCEFKVHLLVPDEGEKKLKEVAGELEYLTASGAKRIDLGMMDFKAGVKSTKAGFSVSKVEPSEWEEDSTTMSLKVDLQRGAFKSAKFYGENGEELDITRSGVSYSGGRILNLDFQAKGRFPSKGRIVLDVWDDVKKHKVGFKAMDISLGRDEPSIDEVSGILIAKLRYVDFPQRYGKQLDSYTLPLVVKLPNSVMKVSGGIIEKVTTAAGKSLLPEWEWWRKISFPELKKDKRTVEFDIQIDSPEKQQEFIKEISGTLEYFTSDGSKTVDTGLIDFKGGTEIEEIGAMIESVKVDELELGQFPYQAILSVEFYSSNGQKLKVIKSVRQRSSGDKYNIIYSVKGSWPPSGRIVLGVAKDLKKHKIGFKAVNILLDGNSFESKNEEFALNDPNGNSFESKNEEFALNGPDVKKPRSRHVIRQFREASARKKSEDLDGAVQIYQDIIANSEVTSQQLVMAYYLLGICYMKADEQDKATETFEHIVSRFPEEKAYVAKAKRGLKKIHNDRSSNKE